MIALLKNDLLCIPWGEKICLNDIWWWYWSLYRDSAPAIITPKRNPFIIGLKIISNTRIVVIHDIKEPSLSIYNGLNNNRYDKTITLKESLCGFSFKLKHIHGNELLFNNNANTTIVKPGFKKIIPNR